MQKPRYKTVRCILRTRGRFLLVVHSNPSRTNLGRWGLPGGRIKRGEDFERALRREIREELFIALADVREVGDYRYKGQLHKVFVAQHDEPIVRFDHREILKLGWHSLEELAALDQEDRLHAGFEARAIRDCLDGEPGR